MATYRITGELHGKARLAFIQPTAMYQQTGLFINCYQKFIFIDNINLLNGVAFDSHVFSAHTLDTVIIYLFHRARPSHVSRSCSNFIHIYANISGLCHNL